MRFGMVGKSGDLLVGQISTVANRDFGGKKNCSIMKRLIFGMLPFLGCVFLGKHIPGGKVEKTPDF